MPADRSATDPRALSGQEADLVPALRAAADEVPRVAARIGPRFAREEARRRAQAYLRGLLSPVERKNGWQLAEAVGDRTPYALQHLLGRADWDPEAVRDDLQAYVVEQLGEAQEQAYVLAVSGKEYVNVAETWTQRRVSTLLTELRELPPHEWQRLSAGDGEKGPRWYDWYRLPLVPPLQEGFARWCLVRRSLVDQEDLQAYVVFAPAGTDLATLVGVAGRRWTIEVAFEHATGEAGRDHYQVRRGTGPGRPLSPR